VIRFVNGAVKFIATDVPIVVSELVEGNVLNVPRSYDAALLMELDGNGAT
jgi:hypothetical protein